MDEHIGELSKALFGNAYMLVVVSVIAGFSDGEFIQRDVAEQRALTRTLS